MFCQNLFLVSSSSKQGFLWGKGRIERFFYHFFISEITYHYDYKGVYSTALHD